MQSFGDYLLTCCDLTWVDCCSSEEHCLEVTSRFYTLLVVKTIH